MAEDAALRTGVDDDRARLEAALAWLGVAYELFACDPTLADTAAFCLAYGFDPADFATRSSWPARPNRAGTRRAWCLLPVGWP